MLKAILAEAYVGARCVLAVPLEADKGVLHALIHIDAGQAGGGQGVARQALTAEGAV
jgi:hypothetical protein